MGEGEEGGMGLSARSKTDLKPKEKRDTSKTRQSKMSVRDVGIMIYLRKSSRYVIDLSNQERREILRDAILRGEAKIQWRNVNATYEAIYNGITNRVIRLEEVSITKLPDRDFEKIKNKCINT